MWYFVPLIPNKKALETMIYKEKNHTIKNLLEYLESVNKLIRGQLVINNILHENELDIRQPKFMDEKNRLFIEFNHLRELKEIIKIIMEKGFAESRFDKIHLYREGYFLK